ncbi:MAG: hypothetical protein ACVCEJ_11250, partial [Candidatus Izemoplasmataceae bacterium]
LVSTLVSLGEYQDHLAAYQALFGETAQKRYHSVSEHVHKYITLDLYFKIIILLIPIAFIKTSKLHLPLTVIQNKIDIKEP